MNHESAGRLRITMFGGLSIDDGGRRLGPKRLGGTRPTQVLEILLAARGERVPTERLAELLWGADPPAGAGASIQTFVSVLRRSLVRDRKRARELIVTERSGYRFATELVELDLDRFDALTDRAQREPPWAARRTLAQALELAKAEPLNDDPYSVWAQELREIYRQRVLDARLAAGDLALGGGDATDALTHAGAATALDPFSEWAVRLAMLALYMLGRQHEALARYREFSATLADQLGLTPGLEARELEGAILRQEEPQLLVTRPVAAPAGPAKGPMLGRNRELQLLRAAIRRGLDGIPTLVQVEGERGSGKTRLIEEVVAEFNGVRVGVAACSQLEQHLDYAPLAGALRAAGVEPEAAALAPIFPELALGRSDQTPEVQAVEALAALVAANAPLLLVLDDLQFADPGTIGALNYLQRRHHRLRASFVFSARSEHTPPYHPVRSLRPDVSVTLAALTADELAPLGVPGLHEATGGVARFVAEVLASEPDQRPSRRLEEAVLAQCWEEGPRAYRILISASLLDPPFEPFQIEAMLGLELRGIAEQLEVLCQRNLLAPDGIGFRFRYPLVREILLNNLTPARTRILQQRIEPPRLAEYRSGSA